MSNKDKQKLTKIKEILDNVGFEIDLKTAKKLSIQGFNSSVYQVDAKNEKLIIHILKPVKEQLKQVINQKILGVSHILSSIKEIPSAKVLFQGELGDGELCFVQTKLLGKNLGKRILENEKIVDVFDVDDRGLYIKKLNKVLALQHKISFSKYGNLRLEGKKLNGTYKSWEEFLRIETNCWFDNIIEYSHQGYKISGEEVKKCKEKIEIFFNTKSNLLEASSASFIHGDMINPGNVLIEEGKITGIVDYEWALAGDPAWEFAYSGNDYIDDYFEYNESIGAKIDRENFKEKMKFYRLPWLVWGLNVHAKGNELKKALFNDLKNSLKLYNK